MRKTWPAGRQGYLTPPVIIILALICLFVAASLYANTLLFKNLKKEPTPTPIPSPTTNLPFESSTRAGDNTANWETYTNNVEKFSVQYPQDWTYKEGFANVQFFPPGETNNDKSIYLSVSDAPPPPCYSELTTLRTVKRGNKEVLVQKGSCYLGGKYTTDEFFQNKYVRLVFGESLDNKYDPIFDQILSTFRFD